MFKKFLPQIIASLFLAGFVAYAWTEPASVPPAGNVPAPINVGATSQTFVGSKTLNLNSLGSGSLLLHGLLNVTRDAIFDANVGIGTATPGAKLEVAGQVKISGGLPGVNKVLTSSDASGLASWQNIPPVPQGLYGICTYEYPVGGLMCVRASIVLPPAFTTPPLDGGPIGGSGYCAADKFSIKCACPAGYTAVSVPNVFGSSLTYPVDSVYTTFCYKN